MEPWTAYHELLSQLIEVTSVGAAGMRLRKPIKVKRPKRQPTTDAPGGQVVTAAQGAGDNAYTKAINALAGSKPSRLRQRQAHARATGSDPGEDWESTA